MLPDTAAARVTAVLGPTNTGKTHLAIERMLGHASGMIGFPLRLLARENYDRIVRVKGPAAVALVTGEERIMPAAPRYFVCTVEAMPLERRVAFLAIDEVQLAADPDRGHIFTDRILNARGVEETMLLGAETIRPLLRALVPGAAFVTRPRLSTLAYTGAKKLARLPRRSAVVAFSAQDVYSIAELLRRTRGGTAVVLGALSPRTRNAQVALFQGGEVDHLVATDAIGMGLNMDVDHVAFASLRKFDGRHPRDLTAAEVAQIAGRAGRHTSDGTFGTTGDLGPIEPEVIERVEAHEFPPLRALYWRNPDLRFTSLQALMGALGRLPEHPGLVRTRPADDQRALEVLARDEAIRHAADRPERIRLLWQVCQIPDFRKVMPEAHARLLGQIYQALTGPAGRLDTDWLAGHLAAHDRTDGDIHALMDRIAGIRVWTYVSQRADWLADAGHWQERARAVEERLSDALHDRLTQRFVDVRTAVLASRLRQGGPLAAAVGLDDRVSVEGQALGRLDGLTFVPAGDGSRDADRLMRHAADRTLRGEIRRRVRRLVEDGDDAFALAFAPAGAPAGDGGGVRVLWRGAAVARLAPGADILRPVVEVPASALLDADGREAVRRRLADWLRAHLAAHLPPLAGPLPADLSGAARGLLFQVGEGLGSIPAHGARAQVAALSAADRKALARLGLRFGVESIYLPALLRPAAQAVRAALWLVGSGAPETTAAAALPGALPNALPNALPGARVSLPEAPGLPAAFYAALGYRVAGGRALRVDALERFTAVLRGALRATAEERADDGAGCPLPPGALSLLGLPAGEAAAVLRGLGYRVEAAADGLRLAAGDKAAQRSSHRSPHRPPRRPAAGGSGADSPFAALRAHPQHKDLRRR